MKVAISPDRGADAWRCLLTAVLLAFTSVVMLRRPGVRERQRRAAGVTVCQQVKIHEQALRIQTGRAGHVAASCEQRLTLYEH